MPLTTFAILMAMWIGVSLPLVFTGSYIGSTQEVIQPPVVVAKDERSVPHQPLILRPIVTCALSGLIPFGAVFVELFFIMTSIWQHQFYYLFGVVFVVFILVLLTGAEVAIVLCYLQLSHGVSWMHVNILNGIQNRRPEDEEEEKSPHLLLKKQCSWVIDVYSLHRILHITF